MLDLIVVSHYRCNSAPTLNVCDTCNIVVGAAVIPCSTCMSRLNISFQSIQTFNTIIQEIKVIIILLEIKKNNSTTGSILWDALDEATKKSKTTKHFRSSYKSSLSTNYIVT